MREQAYRRRTRNQLRRRKLLEQKLYGMLMIAMSIVVLCIASHGKTFMDRDATAVLIFAPLGFYLLFTRKVVIY